MGGVPWPGDSNKPTCLLKPVGARAGLLLAKESLDLRHPLGLAPAVPAPNTAEGAETSEKHEARSAPQDHGQERG